MASAIRYYSTAKLLQDFLLVAVSLLYNTIGFRLLAVQPDIVGEQTRDNDVVPGTESRMACSLSPREI